MKTYILKVKISVTQNWVEDGFDKESAKESVLNCLRGNSRYGLLPFSTESELKIEVS